MVGLKPDRLAVGGDGLVQLPLVSQGSAECEAIVRDDCRVSHDCFIYRDKVQIVGTHCWHTNLCVGIDPPPCAEFGDNLVELSLFRQQSREAAEMPGNVWAKLVEIAEYRDGLVGIAPLLQGMGKLVGRLGADRPRGGVEANRLVGPFQLLQHLAQFVVDPDIAWMPLLSRPQHRLGPLEISGVFQAGPQQLQADRPQFVVLRRLCQCLKGRLVG